MKIFVTPYDLGTKKCTAHSAVAGPGELDEVAAHAIYPGTEVLSQSRRLICLDVGGLGLAFSDYTFSEGPVLCS